MVSRVISYPVPAAPAPLLVKENKSNNGIPVLKSGGLSPFPSSQLKIGYSGGPKELVRRRVVWCLGPVAPGGGSGSNDGIGGSGSGSGSGSGGEGDNSEDEEKKKKATSSFKVVVTGFLIGIGGFILKHITVVRDQVIHPVLDRLDWEYWVSGQGNFINMLWEKSQWLLEVFKSKGKGNGENDDKGKSKGKGNGENDDKGKYKDMVETVVKNAAESFKECVKKSLEDVSKNVSKNMEETSTKMVKSMEEAVSKAVDESYQRTKAAEEEKKRLEEEKKWEPPVFPWKRRRNRR